MGSRLVSRSVIGVGRRWGCIPLRYAASCRSATALVDGQVDGQKAKDGAPGRRSCPAWRTRHRLIRHARHSPARREAHGAAVMAV